jgi:benzoyl-CoA reductase/2-hydroxyglutaryl-CoA dehydratase subunit BcrC/BadD/HgdB
MSLEACFEKVDSIVSSPLSSLRRYHELGKKVVGVLPYHFPEEILYAMDIIPMGLWGADIKVEKAKEYFPSFFCGILQTELEMMLSHRLDELDGVVLDELCDSLKCFSLNVMEARKDMKFYSFPHSLNRKSLSAMNFMKQRCLSFIKEIEMTQNVFFDAEKLGLAISVYNENRTLLKEFSSLCATHLNSVSPLERNNVFKAGYFLDRKEHNEILREINDGLSKMPQERFHGMKVVTTGILADNKEILGCMKKYHIGIVADDVSHESGSLSLCKNPSLDGLIYRYLNVKGDSLLDGSKEERIGHILSLLEENRADGLIYFMTKFCDIEEYDFPEIRKRLEEEGYPCLLLEVDKSVLNSGQSETILETFSEN